MVSFNFFRPGIWSSSIPTTQKCEAAEPVKIKNLQKLDGIDRDCPYIPGKAFQPLGNILIGQVARPYAIGIGVAVLSFLGELTVFHILKS